MKINSSTANQIQDQTKSSMIMPIDSSIKVTDSKSVTEGGLKFLTYKVSVEPYSFRDVEVTLQTSGTATKGRDYSPFLMYSVDEGKTFMYVPFTGKVKIPAWKNIIVKVQVFDDSQTETDETVILSATTNDQFITTSTATGTGIITDNRSTLNPNADEDARAKILIDNPKKVVSADDILYMQYDLKLSEQVGFNSDIKLYIQSYNPTTIRYSIDGGKTFVEYKDKIPALIDGSNTIIQVKIDPNDIALGLNYNLTAFASDYRIMGTNISIDLTKLEELPVTSTDDLIVVQEDKFYILKSDDFGQLSSNVTKIKITELPENGTLLLYGTKIVANQEIYLRDISFGKLTFIPNSNSDLDSTIKFKVGDRNNFSSVENKVVVDIKSVADSVRSSIKLTKNITIDTFNYNDNSKSYKVQAYNLDKSLGEVSSLKYLGLGVKGYASGLNYEIGYKDGKSEELSVQFRSFVSSINVKFAWLASNEEALVKFYNNGVEVGSTTYKGITNFIDRAVNLKPADASVFDEVRFSSSNSTNDYLINTIEYNEVGLDIEGKVNSNIYNVDLSATLKDNDGSESLSVKISGVPNGATFGSPNVKFIENGIWEVKIPEGAKSIDYKSLKMYVPINIDSVNLKIEATSAEKSQYLTGEDIDLTQAILKSTQTVDMKNFSSDSLKVDLKDIVDLNTKELTIKGNKGDIVQLDSVADWTESGKQDTYTVYSHKADASIRLLLEDSIELRDM